jgi:hypothetical protein
MNSFNIKQTLFYTLTLSLLAGQVSLAYWTFNLLHTGSSGFWMAWFLPILLALVVFVMVFLLGVVISGKDNLGWGDWYLTLKHKSFKKVYHSNLGYFIIYIGDDKVKLYQQGWFKLTHLSDFSIDPSFLQSRIKDFLDEKYKEQVKEKKEKDELNSRKNKIKEWDDLTGQCRNFCF